MEKRKNQERENDELRILGVRSGGYGQLPRALMLDRTLSFYARGVAAYFYSYTGAGSGCVFPSRSKILADLGISKDAYYACLHELISQGYLTVERKNTKSARGFGHNVYTLLSYPEKYRGLRSESAYLGEMLELIRESKDMSAGGYGNIPKLVMVDGKLSLKAKALYALMCAFSGESGVALPDQKTVLYYTGLSETTYLRKMQELERAGYICRRTHRIGGRFSGTEVLLCTALHQTPAEMDTPHPQEKDKQTVPDTHIPDMQEKDKQSAPEQPAPDTQLPDMHTPDVQEKDTNINKCISLTNFNMNKVNHSLYARARRKTPESEGETDEAALQNEVLAEGTLPYDWCFRPERLEKGIRMLTHAEKYTAKGADSAERQLYLLFVESLCDMLRADTPDLRVKGRQLSYAKVYDRLAPLIVTGLDEYDEPFAELPFLFDYVRARYESVRARVAIHSPERYLPALIWTELSSGELETADRIAYHLERQA